MISGTPLRSEGLPGHIGVFIYSLKGARKSNKQIERLLFGGSERRVGTRGKHEEYVSTLNEQKAFIDGTNSKICGVRIYKTYRYRGILEKYVYIRPLPLRRSSQR